MESNSTPLWRKKHNPEDKDKVLSTKSNSNFEDKTFYSKYFKSAENVDSRVDTFKTEQPLTSKPYIPDFLKNKSQEFNQNSIVDELKPKEVSKPITLTAKDFPSLGGGRSKTQLGSSPVPTATPSNTPNTFNYLEAARKNADKPAPKPIVITKTETKNTNNEQYVSYDDDYDDYNSNRNDTEWTDDIEDEFYKGKW